MPSACPEIDELERLAQGSLAPERGGAVRAHAAACRECAELLDDIRNNLRFLGDVREVLSTIHAPSAPGVAFPDARTLRDGSGSRGSTVVPPAPAPALVGPYRVVRELGRGGMGVVYEAEQASPRRRVALKLTNAPYTPGSYHERLFLSEVHALARLNNPGIAAIYEAGRADDGRAYFAMELVTGRRLDVACAGRPAREKLALFARVCAAVAAAHERGVVHRDLKPSNIVVTERGDPKVLDFGLARVSEPEWAGAGASPATQPGRVAGTVPYMSPEQARGDTDGVDIRSDVYSLGVVLYQVLSGRMPYDVPTGNVVRAAEVIATAVPEPPGKLDRALGGDVETIVLAALEKDPARRYRSARELGLDIERYLTSRPIDARPPTFKYRARKFLARHRAGAAVAGVFIALLVGFAAAMTWMYLDAAHDRERAENAENIANQQAQLADRSAMAANGVRSFLVNMFRVETAPRAGHGEITARELLDRAADKLLAARPQGDESGRAVLLDSIGRAYSNLGRYPEAERVLNAAFKIRRDLYGNRGHEVGETATALGGVRMALDDLPGAEEAYQAAVDAGHLSEDGGHWHDLLLQVQLADVIFREGRGKDAEDLLRPAIERLRKDPMGGAVLPQALNALAGALEKQKKYKDAAVAMREAISTVGPHADMDALDLAVLQNNLATVLAKGGDPVEALSVARGALEVREGLLPPSHPMIASSLMTVGEALIAGGRCDEAEPILERARAIYLEAGYPAEHQDIAEIERLLDECAKGR
jgi:tetratricopeptide (TPR) repeat protein/predicted Ser/Thr protein kinase